MRKSQDMWCCTTIEEFIQVLNKHVFSVATKKRGKHKTEYIDVTATLDIEDYADAEDGYIYSIALCLDNERVELRYMEDVLELFNRLENEFMLGDDRKLIVYVHNLGHEHYHMTQFLAREWGVPKILLTRSTKPLSIEYDNGIQFRDSLKLFQKSLAGATKGCKHAKMVGDLDYTKRITPDTPLSPDEWNYIINDVQGLYEAIERLKKEHGYNQASIPYTNTGMVIEAVNAEIHKEKSGKTIKEMKKLRLNKHELELAYHCMAGGDTHGARWRAGRVYENCNSYDLKSAHPSQQILRKFPTGKPFALDKDTGYEDLDILTESGKYGWLGKIFICNPQIRPECPDPTLSISKCEEYEGVRGLDNGRLLGADGVICYMDSNDWWRFKNAYTFDDMILIDGIGFQLDYLPDGFRDAVLDKFRVKESAPDGPDRVFAKICVNTIFGACAQKTIRDEYELNLGDIIEVSKTTWEDNLAAKEEDEVEKSQKGKFPFLWGLWTASMSRLALFKLQMAVGWERLIYWDTDSCKYEGEKIPEVEAYNAEIWEQGKARGAIVTNRKGREVCIGVAEDEHPTVDYGYKRFTFLHAKCYAAEAWNGKEYEIETTIAGVRKANGRAALKGDIANLRDGLFIAEAGGLTLTYHAEPLRLRHDFKRPTWTGSWIEMNPRQYLVQSGIRTTFQEELGEIIAE